MAIFAEKNLYQGVNAHLNSLLMADAELWGSFHSVHIVHLAEAIDAVLPSGYVAVTEAGLQIRVDDDTRRRQPDITIYTQPTPATSRPRGGSLAEASHPVMSLLLVDDPEEVEYFYAVTIRRIQGGNLGKVVTWIELLSPSNKAPSPKAAAYQAKRLATLESGIPLVEIDYLHLYPPPDDRIPVYPEAGAYPYWVFVSDPRPSREDGRLTIYGCAVDDPLPNIILPLEGEDAALVRLQPVYDRLFSGFRVYAASVDYEQFPPQFERYSPADQTRIRARMEAAKKFQGGEA